MKVFIFYFSEKSLTVSSSGLYEVCSNYISPVVFFNASNYISKVFYVLMLGSLVLRQVIKLLNAQSFA